VNLDKPERLTEQHDLSAFDAGPLDTEGQSRWLKEHALVNHRLGITRTFVAPYAGTSRVGAFFGLSAASVVKSNLPRKLQIHGTPGFIPAILIARLAVDQPLQGQGIGRGILIATLDQCLRAWDEVAFNVIIVDAAGEKAQRLYAHHHFVALRDASERTTRMGVPVETIRKMLQPPAT
jgi:GNAT superfamily N-acetyltransferase